MDIHAYIDMSSIILAFIDIHVDIHVFLWITDLLWIPDPG